MIDKPAWIYSIEHKIGRTFYAAHSTDVRQAHTLLRSVTQNKSHIENPVAITYYNDELAAVDIFDDMSLASKLWEALALVLERDGFYISWHHSSMFVWFRAIFGNNEYKVFLL